MLQEPQTAKGRMLPEQFPSSPCRLCLCLSFLSFLLCFYLCGALWLCLRQPLLDIALSKISLSVSQQQFFSVPVNPGAVDKVWHPCSCAKWMLKFVDKASSESSTSSSSDAWRCFPEGACFTFSQLSHDQEKNLKMFFRAYYIAESKILQSLNLRSNYGIPENSSLLSFFYS